MVATNHRQPLYIWNFMKNNRTVTKPNPRSRHIGLTNWQSLWNTNIDTNIGQDTITYTLTPIIIWEDDIVACDLMCECECRIGNTCLFKNVGANQSKTIRIKSLQSRPYNRINFQSRYTWNFMKKREDNGQ